MPSGRTHEAINLTSFGVVAGSYAWARSAGLTDRYGTLLASETALVFAVSFLIGTFFITPDLDLAYGRVQARNNWGLLGRLWVPYGRMFRHRGWSHSWVVGPLTRLIYLALIALILSWGASILALYFGYTFRIEVALGENWQELAIGALAGYYLSQWLHLIADGIRPDHKFRLFGRRRRSR